MDANELEYGSRKGAKTARLPVVGRARCPSATGKFSHERTLATFHVANELEWLAKPARHVMLSLVRRLVRRSLG